MIRYVRHKDIDKNLWDNCIWNSPNGLIYAFSWFLDIVAGEWDALVEDDYVAVFPLPVRKKYGLTYAYQPFWTQQLGLFSANLLYTDKLKQFLQNIPRKISYVDINLNSHNLLPEEKNLSMKHLNNYQLDLIYSYEQIKNGYSENLKRNLAKNTDELFFQYDTSPEPIVDLFIRHRGQSIENIKQEDYKRFIHLVYFAQSINVAKTLSAYSKTNELLAAAIFFITKGRAVMLFSATSPEGREVSAMHKLIDGFIQDYEQRNIVLDFEGSNDENLARFYRSFGSANTPYTRLIMNRLPFPLNKIKRKF